MSTLTCLSSILSLHQICIQIRCSSSILVLEFISFSVSYAEQKGLLSQNKDKDKVGLVLEDYNSLIKYIQGLNFPQ